MPRTKWIRWGLVVAIATTTGSGAIAADHLDAPTVKIDPSSDITDLYSWNDGGKVVFVLGVSPLASAMSQFSDKVQYVIHTESSSKFGTAGTPLDIICTFAVDQKISCWIGTKDYVTGDASGTAGLTSASGAVKVFAGLRDDPFFFNLDGFKDTAATVEGAAAALTFDGAGCPKLDAATSSLLVKKLSTDPTSTPPGGPPKDFFAGKNVLAIVLSIDVKLLNGGGPLLASWASTNKGS
jgi:hypothetical protein